MPYHSTRHRNYAITYHNQQRIYQYLIREETNIKTSNKSSSFSYYFQNRKKDESNHMLPRIKKNSIRFGDISNNYYICRKNDYYEQK